MEIHSKMFSIAMLPFGISCNITSEPNKVIFIALL